MSEVLTAMYDERSDADIAVEKLVQAGIERSSIQVLPDSSTTGYSSSEAASYDHSRDEGGFWAALKNLFMPDEDKYSYAEGMSRGSAVLTVTVQDAEIETATSILEEHGSVDVQQRETEWRAGGWGGYSNPSTIEEDDRPASSPATTPEPASGSIPIAEENLNVGKRVEDRGTVRVRSYAVDQPVTRDIDLRNETVKVETRPVDRAAATDGDELFGEKVIEARETAEVPIVSKETRVTGEVGLRKVTENRNETVSDSVRRVDTEVEDNRSPLPTDPSRTGSTDAKRIP